MDYRLSEDMKLLQDMTYRFAKAEIAPSILSADSAAYASHATKH